MYEFFLLFWALAFWGDVAFTNHNFKLLKQLEPTSIFGEYELNHTAVLLVEKYGLTVASLILFVIGLIAFIVMYFSEMHLLIISFTGGLYFMIYMLHIITFFRIKKRLGLLNQR